MKRAVALALALLCAGCSGSPSGGPVTGSPGPADPTSASGSSASTTTPARLSVQVVTAGLTHPWDLGFLPGGAMLVTERPGRLTLVKDGRRSPVAADLKDVYAQGEGGLMGLALSPDFATSREFVTCQTYAQGDRPVDIRLVRWKLSADSRSATKVRILLSGMPIASSGRHSGCRPTYGPEGALYVGTGDTAAAPVAQDLTSLGGKLLRLNGSTGAPWPGNPWITAANPRQRYVYGYGHRNVQGVAVQPGTGRVWTAEHGPDNNDEVNLATAGANYGWDPSRGGTTSDYDEGVPMTDLQRFPKAQPAAWSSGPTTQAICGAAFLTAPQWGGLRGDLVITALKGATLLVLKPTGANRMQVVAVPAETNGTYGRLRAARTGPDGALYVTTSNGTDDKILRITPAG
ncbi:PQQ-dependent sugar dehydrogenase [Calidifontibacter sp. DB0510]|uniref:PQQ-dependent sugar dehydrogenase n=1 Tax=Metallococcus carri TaxID=1656884 RepID=A0A967B6F4_9MICO|nr:PQQ-dependent sugar dehydrogenase [Metallococcus carri]NHN56442.1 PQQ-dependent sugar dehydrogenase [Metallococcus carri]NOP36066.1 PQQ-dependent sugar dehydrogenase [Calidifontibacter sp. DB2511S]